MARASIRSARDFRRVYRAGSKARSDGITVWAAPREEPGETRLGMSIRATAGSAVERNRLRRRAREIFRAFDPGPDADVVVTASPEAIGRNFQQLSEVMTSAFEKAGLRRRT